MKTSSRAVLAVAFLLGFYVATVAAVAALALVAVHTALDAGPGRVAAVTVALLGFALIAVHAVSRGLRKPLPEPVGLPLERENHPDLWAEVDDLAQRVGTRGPDEIHLVAEPAVRVTEDAGRLGLVGGTRRLSIGVPLLLTLNRSEMHAVTAHQLAHLRPGFLGTAAIAYRGQVTLATLAQRERSSSPLGLLMQLCARAYLRVSAPVSRHQEVRADELSARIGGSASAIAALRQVPAVELLWDRYVTSYAFAAPGRRPLRLFEGFAQLWSEEHVQLSLAAVRDEPSDDEPAAYDSHPSTADRLDLLFDHHVGLVADTTPAAQMIKRAGWHAIELETTMFRTSDLRPSTWQEIAEVAGRREVLGCAAKAPERLGACIADLAPGRATVLTADLLPDGATPQQVRETAVELVTTVLEAALLERDQAFVVPSWVTAWRLVDEDGRALDLASDVDAAFDLDAAREALLDRVRGAGLTGYQARPLGSAAAAGAAGGAPSAAETQPEHVLGLLSGRRRGRPLVVAVTDGGVLLSPDEGGLTLAAGARRAPVSDSQRVLETASACSLTSLVATPGTRLVRWGDILEARSTHRDSGLSLRLVSGEKVTVSTARGQVVGEPRPALAQYLGPRYVVAGAS